MAVCLANYAASGLGETTAYLELNQRDEIKYWKEVNKEGYFLEKGVHYYPKIRKERIPLLMNQNYDRIIFNIGTCYVEYREEILRCEQKIFLLAARTWQKYDTDKLLAELKGSSWGGFEPILTIGKEGESVRRNMEKDYGITLHPFPDIENVEKIKAEEFQKLHFFLDHPLQIKRKWKHQLRRKL